MKKYAIQCLQGTEWWSWTFGEPMTASEIRSMFWDYDEKFLENMKFKDLTLDYIQDIWECELIEIINERIV